MQLHGTLEARLARLLLLVVIRGHGISVVFLLNYLVTGLHVNFRRLVLRLRVRIMINVAITLGKGRVLLARTVCRTSNFLLRFFRLRQLIIRRRHVSDHGVGHRRAILVRRQFLLFLLLEFEQEGLTRRSLVRVRKYNCGRRCRRRGQSINY